MKPTPAIRSSLTFVGFVLAAGLAWSPGLAQEEAQDSEESTKRIGNFYIDLGSWVAQPVGMGLVPATEVDLSGSGSGTLSQSRSLEIQHGTEDKFQSRLEYRLPNKMGSVFISLYDHDEDTGMNRSSPGQFIYGEALTHSLFAGFASDTLADTFVSAATSDLRDFRIDYSREAFRSPRVSGDWFVGWRRVEHARQIVADYFAVVPGLPPILPPACVDCLNLDPLPDSASAYSTYEGRGLTGGFDLEFPLWKNRLVLEGGAALTVMRGDIEANYQATNSFYILTDVDGTQYLVCGTPTFCDEQYALFDDVIFNSEGQPYHIADNIVQGTTGVALTRNASLSSQVLENYLGFRWRTPYNRLEVFGGFRQTRYDDVALELRPTVIASDVIEATVTAVHEEYESVTYEGFYGGVTFRLY